MRTIAAAAVAAGAAAILAAGASRADFDVRGSDWMLAVVSEPPVLAVGERGLQADWMHDSGIGARVRGAAGGAGDACAALRLLRTGDASLDVLAGARVRGGSAQEPMVIDGVDPLVALRARTEVVRGVSLECMTGVAGGAIPVPEAEASLRARLDGRWTLGVSAGWRGARDDGWDGEPDRGAAPEGLAFRFGLSAEF